MKKYKGYDMDEFLAEKRLKANATKMQDLVSKTNVAEVDKAIGTNGNKKVIIVTVSGVVIVAILAWIIHNHLKRLNEEQKIRDQKAEDRDSTMNRKINSLAKNQNDFFSYFEYFPEPPIRNNRRAA